MVIYTTEATSVAEVQSAVANNLQGGCQATSESGETYQTNTCTGKYSQIKKDANIFFIYET